MVPNIQSFKKLHLSSGSPAIPLLHGAFLPILLSGQNVRFSIKKLFSKSAVSCVFVQVYLENL